MRDIQAFRSTRPDSWFRMSATSSQHCHFGLCSVVNGHFSDAGSQGAYRNSHSVGKTMNDLDCMHQLNSYLADQPCQVCRVLPRFGKRAFLQHWHPKNWCFEMENLSINRWFGGTIIFRKPPHRLVSNMRTLPSIHGSSWGSQPGPNRLRLARDRRPLGTWQPWIDLIFIIPSW